MSSADRVREALLNPLMREKIAQRLGVKADDLQELSDTDADLVLDLLELNMGTRVFLRGF